MGCGSVRSPGSDWQTMRVVRLDNETGAATPLPDVLTGVKYSTTAWTPDNKARLLHLLLPTITFKAASVRCMGSCYAVWQTVPARRQLEWGLEGVLVVEIIASSLHECCWALW